MTPAAQVVSVSTSLHTIPLPRPLVLGPLSIHERQFAVVHVETADGITGCAYAQTRGAPITEIIDRLLAPILMRSDSSDVEARWRDCFRGTIAIGRTGLIMRAISLIDIALWDIRAIRAGEPLHRILGAPREPAPVDVMFVAGYPTIPSDVDGVTAAATRAAEAGHSLVKIARPQDPETRKMVLRELSEHLPAPTRVVVDASWFWQEPDQAIEEVRGWAPCPIAWIEDPFPAEQVHDYARLRGGVDYAVGGGDEVTDQHAYHRLVEVGALDVVRLDVATVGGVTAAVRVARQAELWGLPVSMHISPEVSVHLAAALPAIVNIETFDRAGNRYDPSHELCQGGPTYLGGSAMPPTTPGIGIELPD